MRCLRVTLRTSQPVVLPLAYNELVQGLLYHCWRDRFPHLHDEGFAEGRPLRLFTFGPITGRSSVDRERRTIRFDGPMSFEVRTSIEDLLDELATQLAKRGAARIGAHELCVANLEAIDRLIFPRQARIQTVSPVVCYRTLEDGHTQPYAPTDEGWIDLVRMNAQRKAEALALGCDNELQVIPLAETLRKRVTRFKGTYVTGWVGSFAIACDPVLLAALYSCGLGSKSSQGFGMFNICD